MLSNQSSSFSVSKGLEAENARVIGSTEGILMKSDKVKRHAAEAGNENRNPTPSF